MAPKAKDANATLPQQPQEELDEETPDIMPDRTLTAEEAEQDYQRQLALLAEQETECNNDRRSSDSLLEDGAAVEKNAIR
jgi:hypothetical protein